MLRFSAKILQRVQRDSGSSVLPCPWLLGLIHFNKVCGLHTRSNRSGQPAICNELLRERAERPNLRRLQRLFHDRQAELPSPTGREACYSVVEITSERAASLPNVDWASSRCPAIFGAVHCLDKNARVRGCIRFCSRRIAVLTENLCSVMMCCDLSILQQLYPARWRT